MFYELPKTYSEDKEGIVILDSTNTLRKFRIDKNEEFKQYFEEIDLVYFDIEKDVLLKQNLEREFPIPSDVLIKYYDTFERPNEEDENFFDNVKVKPHNNPVPAIDGTQLTVELKPLSWNVIRLKK